MTRTLLIAGTASHVGKSTVAAGLCRYLADRGVEVAPFKAQNMSNNARVAVRPDAGDESDPGIERVREDGSESGEREDGESGEGGYEDDVRGEDERRDGGQWGEIGVSQFVQARAARRTPTTDCNPVLLKPRGEGESQLVIRGRALEHVPSSEYYGEHWERARKAAEESHRRLANEVEVVVAEGAGSIAEINLRDRDLANVETARFADAEILLLVDIERGGAFASLYGTLELLPDDLRDRVVGSVITKFRGDRSLLEPGIDEIESRTGVQVLGVIPYEDPGLPEEDSVSLPAIDERGVVGDDDVPEDRRVTVAVPRLPRISNATDLEALAGVAGVRVRYVPLEGDRTDPENALGDADAVVLPGTKNTVDDLLALRESGFGDALAAFENPIVGLCGGYQMLGERITNAAVEGTGERAVVSGLGLLPVETRFESEKRLERTTVRVDGCGPIAGASGTASGYEIHAGRTTALGPVDRPLGPGSAVRGDVLGTYLHGAFDNRNVREAFVNGVYRRADRERPRNETGPTTAIDGGARGEAIEFSAPSPYDRAARLVAEHVDLTVLGDPFV